MDTSTEEWKPIEGHKGYEVSSMGRVRSYRIPRHRGFQALPRILKTTPQSGYLCVTLSDRKTHGVHRLVASSFIGAIPAGMQVAHLDGNPTNNVVINLAITTPKVNQGHRKIHGTHAMGEKNANAILTDELVKELRSMKYYHGIDSDFANRIGAAHSAVQGARTGRTWRHVTTPPHRSKARGRAL